MLSNAIRATETIVATTMRTSSKPFRDVDPARRSVAPSSRRFPPRQFRQLRRELNASNKIGLMGIAFDRRWLALALAVESGFGLLTREVAAQTKPESAVAKRLEASSKIVEQFMSSSDHAIPVEVLRVAKCFAVVPSMVRVALGIGGSHGTGVVTCRTAKGWSPPAPITLNGGSVGPQFGGQSKDLLVVVLNQSVFNDLLSKRLKIGKGVAESPGPLQTGGDHNEWRASPILSYSQTRGVFEGVDLKGTAIRQDKNATISLYNRYVPILSILSGEVPAPSESKAFLSTIRKCMTDARHEPD
jgi:lipid-binding SYLF domain-containing protein